MANHEIETDPWVDRKLVTFLIPDDDWRPDPVNAFATLQARKPRPKRWWIALPIATSLACMALFFLPASRACAQSPAVCAEDLLSALISGGPVQNGFKQAGSP